MEIAKYVTAIALGIAGLVIIIMNWRSFISRYMKEKRSSMIPVFGGAFLCVAIALFPRNSFPWAGVFAFVVDIGSFPSIVGGAVYVLIKKIDKGK